MHVKRIRVWMPGTYKNIPTEYPGEDVTDYTELDNGDTLVVVLNNGSRLRFHRMPYVVELHPIAGQ